MSVPVIVGQDPVVRKAAKLAERLAHTIHPIFVEGEQGAGREHLARFLHARGPRAAAPFSIIDFGAAAGGASLEDLAAQRRAARRGTLLIKNCELIAETDVGLAVSLVAEAADSTRVVLAASGLPAADSASRLPSLAERIGALTLYLPPLRARRTDIAELVYYFLDRWSAENGRARAEVSDAAMLGLWRYDWPGNARELGDEVLAAWARAEGGRIESLHLSQHLCLRSPAVDSPRRSPSKARTSLPVAAGLAIASYSMF